MAFSMQGAYFIGVNVTRDAELKYANGGTAILSFSVAYNYRKSDGTDEVEYFDVVVFGKSAESAAPMIRKGVAVSFTGRLKQDRWPDKDTGKTREKIRIIADRVRVERNDHGQAAPDYDAQQPDSYGGNEDF